MAAISGLSRILSRPQAAPAFSWWLAAKGLFGQGMATPAVTVFVRREGNLAMALAAPLAGNDLFHVYLVAASFLFKRFGVTTATVQPVSMHTMGEDDIGHHMYLCLHEDQVV